MNTLTKKGVLILVSSLVIGAPVILFFMDLIVFHFRDMSFFLGSEPWYLPPLPIRKVMIVVAGLGFIIGMIVTFCGILKGRK